ncbi:MAG: hypothetical protein LC104_06860 [Bacteroidales bacterium]|nr:hypothetical protein [Bacteroidales bacterium]
MNRLLLVGMLALPAALLGGTSAQAQCAGGRCGGGFGTLGPGAAPTNAFWGSKHIGGCGVCMGLFGRIHQHGPLFNYGPYMGYYPFQPYGDWTADLKYTGPSWYAHERHQLFNGLGLRDRCWGCGGLFDRLKGHCSHCGHGGWGEYSRHTFRNVFHRLFPGAHKHGSGCCFDSTGSTGCQQCNSPAPTAPQAAPAQPAAPKLLEKPVASTSTNPELLQTSFPRRER